MNKRPARVRLSLSQRERIEVRDCSESVPQAPAKLPGGRYRFLPEFDDSKSGSRQYLRSPEIPLVHDPAFCEDDSHGPNHPTRLRVSRPDNRNPECKDRWDAAAGICNGQSFDFEDVAKECARNQWRFCGGSGGGTPRNCLAQRRFVREEKSFAPHLNPLPAAGERRISGGVHIYQ